MTFLIGLLTVGLVLDCFILIFLVLLQLPKKEAGAGLAFGGAATDALFGAGSGTALTKITKYSATAFFVLALTVSLMQSRLHTSTGTSFGERLMQQGKPPAAAPLPPPGPTTSPATTPAPPATNLPILPPVEATNLPATPPAPTTPPASATPPPPAAPTNAVPPK